VRDQRTRTHLLCMIAAMHVIAMRSPLFTSIAFQTFVLIIIAFFTLVVTIIALLAQSIFARRWLVYELLAAGPIIQMPTEGSKDLAMVYDGTVLDDPRFAQLRLVNRSGKDIPSDTFDQGMPLRFDLGVTILKVLQTTLVPNEPPLPRVRIDDQAVEIGPSLIRKKSQINLVLIADGPITSLTCHNPLVDVKVTELVQEDPKGWHGMNLKTILGWVAVAFVVWWIIEDPEGAAMVVHNVGTFLSSAARGISNFFASL
jgi:hypothetical protein